MRSKEEKQCRKAGMEKAAGIGEREVGTSGRLISRELAGSRSSWMYVPVRLVRRRELPRSLGRTMLG